MIGLPVLDKNVYGYLSLLLDAISLTPYLYSVIAGRTKPHVFSWIIWTLTSGITTAGQYAGNAGPGCWAMALTTVFCGLIALFSFTHGERSVSRSDWMAFICALSALPLWYYTKTPLTAILITTTIDSLAYSMTFRKAYAKPHEEMIFMWLVCCAMYGAMLFAIENYSLTTVLCPVALCTINLVLVLMLVWRRWQLKTCIAYK